MGCAQAAGDDPPPHSPDIATTTVESTACDNEQFVDSIAREAGATTGPLQLQSVACLSLPSTPFSRSAPMLSSDGTKYFVYDGIRGLWTGTVGSNDPPRNVMGRLTFDKLGYADTLPFAWSGDSRTLLGARQKTVHPNGWALEPLVPISITGDADPVEFAAVTHPAGPLDGLTWVGSEGLAIAEFGTKGGYYRPEHTDNSPTIAIIDGVRGKVLQSMVFPEAESPLGRSQAIDARIDREGRVHAVWVFDNRWFEWRQGTDLRPLPMDMPSRSTSFALTPNLEKLLLVHGLSAQGIICEFNADCPAPTPTTGVIADLRELETGRIIWEIQGTAHTFSGAQKPVISPDGQQGLVMMPRKAERPSQIVAVVSMRDGRILQELYFPSWGESAYGFGDDGRSVWISGGNVVLTFR